MDFNGDGAFTVSDVWLLLQALLPLGLALIKMIWAWFCFPGNYAISAMFEYYPGVVVFLELASSNAESYHNGGYSGLLSFFTYFTILVILNAFPGFD